MTITETPRVNRKFTMEIDEDELEILIAAVGSVSQYDLVVAHEHNYIKNVPVNTANVMYENLKQIYNS